MPAPGARVVIRDAEWVIRRVDRCPDGGYRLVCDGVSELVREREAIFLTRLESDIRVLDRLVVFTERIETLKWLRDRLAKDLRLRDNQVEMLHGGLSDVDQQRVVEDFGNAARPLRLLICSDVASEGINLHFQCHRLIHFDMPWSLMVFQQRNGRVDRYWQERTPHIVYLVTESANETIRGDTRILEVLAEKDEQAHRNIGDPSAFMRVYDIDAEEEITRDAIAAGERADRFDARLSPSVSEGDDLLALFLGTHGPEDEPSPEAPEPPPAPTSLFESDLAYCEAALHRLREKDRTLRFESDVTGTVLTLDAPGDLSRRFEHFPREVTPENGRFTLTADRNRMRDAIVDSRREETAWPTVHYLWRLNPVVGWLNDRMLAAFGRHQAPVLTGAPGLAAAETVFVLSGLVPNRRSHPLLYEWVAVAYREHASRRSSRSTKCSHAPVSTATGSRTAVCRRTPMRSSACCRTPSPGRAPGSSSVGAPSRAASTRS